MTKEQEKYTTLDTEQCKWWVNTLFSIAKEKACNSHNFDDAEEMQSAQDKIIKALERQPSEDCVSRQAVLDLMQLKMGGRELYKAVYDLPPVTPTQSWIPVSERLPETDNENSINNYNVLLWVKNKSHPEREPQIYLGKLRHIDGDDGSGNFWRIETKPCDWTIWGWSYLNEPDVIAWQPLPRPYEEKRGNEE